jgi:hypothetical protein
MTTFDYATDFSPSPRRRGRLAGAARYVLVLTVWAGLFLVRPRLAMEIFRERRTDSPIPRWRA